MPRLKTLSSRFTPCLSSAVLAGTLLLVASCGPGANVEQAIIGSKDRGESVAAESEIRQIGMAIQAVHLQTGEWPESLQQLVDDRTLLTMPMDPYGQPYIYETADGRGTPRLYSAGKDEQAGTADDIEYDFPG